MSSLESKIESNSSPNYGDCRICNKEITNETYCPLSGIKIKSSKTTTIYDVCNECQEMNHLCSNECGKYLSIKTFINGHNKILCNREYRKSHPHTYKDAKIAELQNQLEEITTMRNYWRKQAEYWKNMYKHKDEHKKDILTPQLKQFVNDLIRENVKNRLIHNCDDCRPCMEYYSHKHTCGKCKLCKNCHGKVTIYDNNSIEIDCSNELNSVLMNSIH